MNSHEVAMAVAYGIFDIRKHVVVPNCQVLGHEADLTILQPSGWCEEVEIKISVSDFKRDFTTKALKHKSLQLGNPHWDSAAYFRSKGGVADDYYRWDLAKPHLVKRFWFAVPLDILDKVKPLTPEYAGLISVEDGRRKYAKVVKKAPNLKMSRKFTDAERIDLLRLAYVRYWSIRHKLNDGDRSLWEAAG